MLQEKSPATGRASADFLKLPAQPFSAAPDSAQGPLKLTPEQIAALGLGRWRWPIWRGLNLCVTPCPRCEMGLVGMLPPTAPGETFLVIAPCRHGLRCPPAAIREAARAVLRGHPVPVDAGDAERLGRFLPRVIPDLWFGRRGRDPGKSLWAARFALEELGLAPHLVTLALRALARRRGWLQALADAAAPSEEEAA